MGRYSRSVVVLAFGATLVAVIAAVWAVAEFYGRNGPNCSRDNWRLSGDDVSDFVERANDIPRCHVLRSGDSTEVVRRKLGDPNPADGPRTWVYPTRRPRNANACSLEVHFDASQRVTRVVSDGCWRTM